MFSALFIGFMLTYNGFCLGRNIGKMLLRNLNAITKFDNMPISIAAVWYPIGITDCHFLFL